MSAPRLSVEERLREIVRMGTHSLDWRLRQPSVTRVVARAAREVADEEPTIGRVVAGLAAAADDAMLRIRALEVSGGKLVQECQAAKSDAGRREVLVKYLLAQGKPPRESLRDLRALSRWLDLEAIQERIATDVADALDEIDLAYQALAHLVFDNRRALEAAAAGKVLAAAIRHAQGENRPPARRSALRFIRSALRATPVERRASVVGISFARQTRQWALGDGAKRWVQVLALEVCALLFPEDAHHVVIEVLGQRLPNDGMVIRRNALRVLATLDAVDRLEIAMPVRSDPSEHVRQELARFFRQLATSDSVRQLLKLVHQDPSARVSGVALRELTELAIQDPRYRKAAVEAIDRAIRDPKRTLTLRVAMESVRKMVDRSELQVSPSRFAPGVAATLSSEATPAVFVEELAGLLRFLEVRADPKRDELCKLFCATIPTLLEGESTLIEVPSGTRSRDLELAAAVAARGDMSLSLARLGETRYRMTRGEPRGFRWWRALNEARTPMPDKRKGYLHTHARVFSGEIIVPPIGMAEVTPTRVPGERQLYGSLGGWGVFLPRVDDLLYVTRLWERPLRIVTSFGTLELQGPEGLLGRLRAWARISWRYVAYAAARERSLASTESKDRQVYAELVEGLGIRMRLIDRKARVENFSFTIPATLPTQYYAASSAAFFVPPIWVDQVLSYMFSPFGSTPAHLAIVAGLIFIGVVLRSAWIMEGVEKTRAGVPLTIGGWGTRGKSGSERLKAALFHALRYDVVVKTTGCEAMFIHAMRDLPAGEIFIYRPYDKATIWEQKNVLYVAHDLHAQVFLWECMALQPRFIDTLANEWMQDEVTTLTNAYPDHEDIQGPGGEDVARVISRFMPIAGKTFTTEEQMLPLIQDGAKRKRTDLSVVAPIEADLLPIDLLERLPYQEHPRNVAMVLALADHFGVDREFALVEIADHVIMDLGVLKTYPEVQHRGRKLIFSNGMSANERAGFMSNWTRLGFDKNDIDTEPQITTIAVVNNRGDRVARSRVFAQIFVDDAPIDHVVLINTNLGGMMQFIQEALEKKLADLRITGEGGADRALGRFDEQMRWLKIPSKDEALRERVRRMVAALPLEEVDAERILATDEMKRACADLDEGIGTLLEAALANEKPAGNPREDRRADIVRHAARLARRMRARKNTRQSVAEALGRGDEGAANQIFRDAYRTLFMDRIAVLWDSGATGDQVIDFLTAEVPPGQTARIMGTQNIKGTGLDFVYRWLSIDRVRANLERLETDPPARPEILAWLGSYSDFGLVDCREALDTLNALREKNGAGWAELMGLVEAVMERLSKLEKEKAARLVSSGKASLGARVLLQIEAFVDYLDSVRRTRLAARVMNDLFAKRVGHTQAAILLRDVTGRQKGGWLAKDIAKWRKKQAVAESK